MDAARHHDGVVVDLPRPAHGRRGDVGPARPEGLAVVPDDGAGGRRRRRAARDAGARRGEARVAAAE